MTKHKFGKKLLGDKRFLILVVLLWLLKPKSIKTL